MRAFLSEVKRLKSNRDRKGGHYYEMHCPWFSYAETSMITKGLLARGYSEQDILKILGGNWLRVFERVWGS